MNPLFPRYSTEAQRQAHLEECHSAGIVTVSSGGSLHDDNAVIAAELATMRTFGPEGIQCVCTCVPVTEQAAEWPVTQLRALLTAHKARNNAVNVVVLLLLTAGNALCACVRV